MADLASETDLAEEQDQEQQPQRPIITREIARNPIVPSAPADAADEEYQKPAPAAPQEPGAIPAPGRVPPKPPLVLTGDRKQNVALRQERAQENFEDRQTRFNAGEMYDKQQAALRQQKADAAKVRAAQATTYSAQEQEKQVVNTEERNTLRDQRVETEQNPDTGLVQPVRDERGQIKFKAGRDEEVQRDRELHSVGRAALGEDVYNSALKLRELQATSTTKQADLKKLRDEAATLETQAIGKSPTPAAAAAKARLEEINPQIDALQQAGYGKLTTSTGKLAAPDELVAARKAHQQLTADKAAWSALSINDAGQLDDALQERKATILAAGGDPDKDRVVQAIEGRRKELGITAPTITPEEKQLRADPTYGPILKQRDALDAQVKPLESVTNKLLTRIETAAGMTFENGFNPTVQSQGDPDSRLRNLQNRLATITDPATRGKINTLLNAVEPRLAELRQTKEQRDQAQGQVGQRLGELKTAKDQADVIDALKETDKGMQWLNAAVLYPSSPQFAQQVAQAKTEYAAKQQKEHDENPWSAFEPSTFEREVTASAARMLGEGIGGFVKLGEAIHHQIPFTDPNAKSEIFRRLSDSLLKVPGLVVNPEKTNTFEAKAGRFVGGVATALGEGAIAPEILVPQFFGQGFHGQADSAKAYFDKRAAATPGAPRDLQHEENVGLAAGVVGGTVNALLAIPFGSFGKVIGEVFGSTKANTISSVLKASYERGGAEAVAQDLNVLKAAMLKTAGPAAFKETAAKSLEQVIAEITKTPLQRIGSVATGAAKDAALFSAVQLAENATQKTYNPETGLFENVATAAGQGAILGTFFKGIREIARAKKASTARTDIAAESAKQARAGEPGYQWGPDQRDQLPERTGQEPPPPATEPSGKNEAPKGPTPEAAHAEIDSLQPSDHMAPEQVEQTQHALRGLVKIATGQPMDALTAVEKQALLKAKTEDGMPRVEMVKGPEGARPVITDGTLARVRAIAPTVAQLLPADEESQRQEILNANKPTTAELGATSKESGANRGGTVAVDKPVPAAGPSQPTFAVEVENAKGETTVVNQPAATAAEAKSAVAKTIKPGAGLIRDATQIPAAKPKAEVSPKADFVERAVQSATEEKGGKLSPDEEKQVRVVARIFKPHVERWEKAFESVGLTNTSLGTGGAIMAAGGKKLMISVPDVVKNGTAYAGNKAHAANVVTEEAIHSVTVHLEDSGKIDLVKLYKTLPVKIHEAMKGAYKVKGGKPSQYQYAHEFWRMWMQGDMELQRGNKIRLKDKFLQEQTSRAFVVENRKALATLLRFFRDMSGQLDRAKAGKDVIAEVGRAQDLIRAKVKEVDAHAQPALEKGGGRENQDKTDVSAEPGAARGPPVGANEPARGATSDNDSRAVGADERGRGENAAAKEDAAGKVESVARKELSDEENAERPTSNAQSRTEALPANTAASDAGLSNALGDEQQEIRDVTKAAETGDAHGSAGAERSGLAPTSSGTREQITSRLGGIVRGAVGATSRLTQNGRTVEVAYVAQEASAARPSHDAQGRAVAGYDQDLQPRDRSLPQYRKQAQNIASNLDFAQAAFFPETKTPATTADLGAPVMTLAGDTLIGNGREIGIRTAYEQGLVAARKYKADFVRNAKAFGIDPAVVIKMKAPVLKRVLLEDLPKDELVRLSQESNEGAAMASNEIEVAAQDASKLTPELLSNFDPNYDLGAAKNQGFLRAYSQNIIRSGSANESNATRAELARRVRMAIFTYAYGTDAEGRAALDRLTREQEDAGKTITNALLTVAPIIARMRNDIRTGDLHDLDIAPAVTRAGQDIVNALDNRPKNQPAKMALDGLLNQGRLSEDSDIERKVLDFLVRNRGNRGVIEEALSNFAQGLYQLGSPKEGQLFGEIRVPTTVELWERATTADALAPKTEARALAAQAIAKTLPDVHPIPHTLEDLGRTDLLELTDKKTEATITADSRAAKFGLLKPGTHPREVLHRAILRHFLLGGTAEGKGATPIVREDPSLLLMAGGGGAGKSSILRAFAPGDSHVLVNADEIREFLPEYEEMNRLGDGRSSRIAHEEASALSKRLLDMALSRKVDVTYDGTLANAKTGFAAIDKARAAGYRVKMLGVTIDPTEALRRAYKRAKTTGRYVPDGVLREAHRNFNGNIASYISKLGAENVRIFDNTGAKPEEIPVAQIQSGEYKEVDERAKQEAGAQAPGGSDRGRSESAIADGSEAGAGSVGSKAGRHDGAPNFIGPDDPLASKLVPVGKGADPAFNLHIAQGLFDQGRAIYSVLPDGAEAVRLQSPEDFHSYDSSELYTLAAQRTDAGTLDLFADYAATLPAAAKVSKPALKREVAKDVPALADDEAALAELFEMAQPKALTETAAARNGKKGPKNGSTESRRDDANAGAGDVETHLAGIQTDSERPGSAEGVAAGAVSAGGGRKPRPGGPGSGGKGDALSGPGTASDGTLGGAEPGGTGEDKGGVRGSVGKRSDASREPALIDRPAENSPDRNARIDPARSYAPRQGKERFNANIAAIQLMRTLENEGRNATPAEKETLLSYTGWGWMKEAFNKVRAAKWEAAQTALRARYDAAKDYFARQPRYATDPGTFEQYREHETNAGYSTPTESEKRLASWAKNYLPFYEQLRSELSPEEFDSAAKSVRNAHYTDVPVIAAMWKLVERLGFKGGHATEPGAGIGHFIGAQPDALANRTTWNAVELDDVTARILGHLYPEVNVNGVNPSAGRKIEGQGFQEARIPANSQDLVISNVPFAKEGPSQSEKEFGRSFNLHNYFFARAFAKAKPGGLVVFITSNSTMDNNLDQRQALAAMGDLIGAIRLPNTAFKANAGTEVTTDIMVFRKPDGTHPVEPQNWTFTRELAKTPMTVTRTGNTGLLEWLKQQPPEWVPQNPEIAAAYAEWVGARRPASGQRVAALVKAVREAGQDGEMTFIAPVTANEYWQAHPEHALGEHTLKGTMYRADTYSLEPRAGEDLIPALDKAIDTFPKNVTGSSVTTDAPERKTASKEDKMGSFVVRDDDIYQVDPDGLTRPDWADNPKKVRQFRSWARVRDAYNTLIDLELKNGSDEDINAARRSLNIAYDNHRIREGVLALAKRNPLEFLSDDPDYIPLQALEVVEQDVDAKGKPSFTYKKADIFSKRQIHRDDVPSTAETIHDAVLFSMTKNGFLHIPSIASALDITEPEAEQQLIDSKLAFVDPVSGLMDIADNYLSGNVSKKLDAAVEAAKDDHRFRPNVEALQAVQPPWQSIAALHPNPRANWTPAEVIKAFAENKLGLADVNVSKVANATVFGARSGGDTPAEFEGGGLSAADILHRIIQDKKIVVKESIRDANGNRREVVNSERTATANLAREAIERAFDEYVKTAEEKVTVDGKEMTVPEAAEEAFNKQVGGWLPPTFNGDWITLPGQSGEIYLDRGFRKAVLARLLTYQYGMIAHGVGSGKTLTQVALIMELRRLGKAKKPVVVVEKSTIGQFASSWRRAYPQAKLLVAGSKNFGPQDRARFLGMVQAGDWDGIIMTRPQATKIPHSPEALDDFIAKKLSELDAALEAAEEGSDAQGAIQAMRDSLTEMIQGMADKLAQNADLSGVTWERLGVDAMVVDEAHNYKNTFVYTAKENVKNLPSGQFSQQAISMELKTAAVRNRNNGKGIYFATGTPVSNAMHEAWVMMNYIAPHVLEENGVGTFDQFADTYGVTVTSPEASWKGEVKDVTRFAKFVHGQSLINLVRSVFDVAMGNEKLGLDVPKVKGGAPKLMILPQTPPMEAVNDWIVNRVAAEWTATFGEKDENGAVIIPAMQDLRDYIEANPWVTAVPIMTMQGGIAAALDPRLLHDMAEDHADSKVNTAVRMILERYKDPTSQERKTTQVVFSDLRRSFNTELLEQFAGSNPFSDLGENARSFDLYEDIAKKLIAGGIPRAEIGWIEPGISDEKKEAFFDKVNAGEVRVLIGGEGISTGVNIQERLGVAYHLMPPRNFKPAQMEQRNGRLIRQGNLWAEWGHNAFTGEVEKATGERFAGNQPLKRRKAAEAWLEKNDKGGEIRKAAAEAEQKLAIEIFELGMEKSLDSAIYSMMSAKQGFIGQVLSGNAGSDFEDPTDSVQMSMAEMAAQTIGDPRLIRKIEIERVLKKIRTERATWVARRAELASQVRSLNAIIPGEDERIAKQEALSKTVGDMFTRRKTADGKDMPALYEMGDGKVFDPAEKNKSIDKETGGIYSALNQYMMNLWATRRGAAVAASGSLKINGTPVRIEVTDPTFAGDKGMPGTFRIEGDSSEPSFYGAQSLLTGIRNRAGNIAPNVEERKMQLANNRKRLAKAQAALDAYPAAFEKEEEFQKLTTEHQNVRNSITAARAAINAERQAHHRRPVTAPAPAPVDDGAPTALAAQPTDNPLFEQGLPLATQIANRYNNIRGVEPGDVLSRARSALARAADKFDPARGAFLPFAKTAINNELRGMYRAAGRNREDTTLDAPANNEARMTNAERLAAPSDTRSEVELAESRGVLDSAVAELPARMQGAITGILDGDTLETIGERLGGISRQAVGRLAGEAMRRLRGKLGERGITSARDLLAQAITPDGKQPQEYKRSSTQVTLSKDEARPFVEFGKAIPENEIAPDTGDSFGGGRDDEPHITALYGITQASPTDTAKAVLQHGVDSITATVGKLSIFQAEKYDVLKADIESPQLHAINAALRKEVPFESDFPDYKPHLTIAYLKKGEGKKYVGDPRFDGMPLNFSELDFRSKDGRKYKIDLTANGAGADAKLAIIEAHVADALKAQASSDPLQQLIDSLDADALEKLFDKASAEERGSYETGRPDLAMGAGASRTGDSAAIRATDQHYTDLFKSKTRATMAEEADQILADRGVTGFAQEIAHRWINGDSLRDGEVMAAKTVLSELSRHTDTPEGIKRMMAAGFAYRNIRGVEARSMAAGFDPHKTPEERNREFIAKAISTLPKKTENAIEAEKDPDKKRSLLDAAMKERLTQLEKAFAYLSKGGLTLEDVLGGGWELHGKGVKLIEGEMESYDVPHQKALKLAQTGARSAKEIAKATGLSEAEVERVNDQFISSLRDKLREKVRAGLTLEKIDLQGALLAQETGENAERPTSNAQRSNAEVEAELNRIIKGMGFVAAKDLGKFKVVKRKRSKLFVPPAVPYTGRVPDSSPVPFEKRRQNQIPFKPGDEFKNVNPKPGDQVAEPIGRVLGQIGLPLYQEMMVRKGADMGSVDDVVKIARVAQAANGNRADMIFEAWVASILSGPTTHAAYKMALAANAGFEFSIQRGVEALVNLGYRDKDSATFGEFKHILKGVLPGIVKGITLGARQWNTESELFHHEVMNSQVEMFDEMPATGYQRAPAISERPVEQFFGPAAGKVDDALSKLGRANPVRGRVVRIPFRALYFIDGFYKMANAQMGVMQFAYRMAKAEGLKGDALSGRINELVATPGSPAWLKAADMAEWLTFRSKIPTKEQGGNWIDNAVAQIARARNKSHAIGSQIPFVQLPYNIVKVGFSKAFAPAITAYKFAKAGAQALPRPEYDAEEGAFKMKDGKPFFESYSKAAQVRDVATSLIALGTMTAIWNMVAGDGDDDDKKVLITGSTPYTQLKRGVRELQQHSYGGPYVLRIGGRGGFHFNFGKYEPFATVLGTLADTVIQLKHLVRGQESPKEAMDALAGYFIAQAQEKTFLRGLDNISKVLGGEMGMTEFAANLVLQGLVPALIRQPLRNLDDYMPNWKESGGMYRLLPAAGFRQPKIDVYGHPVEKTGNWFTRMFAPNSAKPAEHLQKADALLLRWNNEHPRDVHAPSAPTTTYTDGAGKTQPMTPEQSTRYLTATGHRFEQMLRGQISQRQIEHPREEDVKMIENLHKAAAEQIKREMFPKGSSRTGDKPPKHASSVNLIKAWRRERAAA